MVAGNPRPIRADKHRASGPVDRRRPGARQISRRQRPIFSFPASMRRVGRLECRAARRPDCRRVSSSSLCAPCRPTFERASTLVRWRAGSEPSDLRRIPSSFGAIKTAGRAQEGRNAAGRGRCPEGCRPRSGRRRHRHCRISLRTRISVPENCRDEVSVGGKVASGLFFPRLRVRFTRRSVFQSCRSTIPGPACISLRASAVAAPNSADAGSALRDRRGARLTAAKFSCVFVLPAMSAELTAYLPLI